MKTDNKKIGLFGLIGLVISAVVGAGIFNLSKEIANHAAPGTAIIGWIIVGIGMSMLVACMYNLNAKRPDLNTGIISYAQEGFGNYVGFNSVWGYWISIIIGCCAFGTLMINAMGYFFPILQGTKNYLAVFCASIILWIIHTLIIMGLKRAVLFNALVMLAKLVPVVIFVVCVSFAFNSEIFVQDFWGNLATNTTGNTSIIEQLQGTVLVTVWVFIGIEGAIVFSERADDRKNIGRATVLGFIAIILIYSVISLLAYGILPQEQIKQLPNPAMGYVLELVIGKAGAVIVNIGVIISIFGAWISNTLLAQEVAYQAAFEGLFPKFFMKENKYGMPVNSNIITNGLVQILLISLLFTEQAYSLLSQLSASTILLPYACVCLFQIKEIIRTKEKIFSKYMLAGIIGTLYWAWIVYSLGLIYIVLTIISLCPGSIMYIYVKKMRKEKVFETYEWVIFSLVVILFIYGLYKLPEIMVSLDI